MYQHRCNKGSDEPIATFNNCFKSLAVQGGISEYGTLSETYKKGIHPLILDHIQKQLEQPTQMESTTTGGVTTKGWYKAAELAELALKRNIGDLNKTVQERFNSFRNNFRRPLPQQNRFNPPRPFVPQYRPFVPNRPSPLNPNYQP